MSIPSGPVPLWIVCVGALLAIVVPVLAVWARRSRHERSIHHRERGWRE